MKKIVLLIAFLCIVFAASIVEADVDVNISIGVPPPLAFAGPPELVVVPSGARYVYMIPDMLGIYYYGGYWYRIHDGHWFRAGLYSGPWAPIVRSRVPRVIVNVPPDYHLHLPPGYHRIHYDDVHRHWRSWDKKRHWHKYDWYKQEFRRHEKQRHHGDRRPPDVHKERKYDGPKRDSKGGKKHRDDRRDPDRGRKG